MTPDRCIEPIFVPVCENCHERVYDVEGSWQHFTNGGSVTCKGDPS